MRRKHLFVGIVLLLLMCGVLIIYRRAHDSHRVQREQQLEQERIAAISVKDAQARSFFSEWSTGQVVPLGSSDLDRSTREIPSGGLPLTVGAIPVSAAGLSSEQDADLSAAIAGLLQAYGKDDPAAVIAYMLDRDKEFDERLKPVFSRALSKKGQTDLDGLSGPGMYARMWNTFKLSTHWSGYVPESSCKQVWNARSVPLKAIARFYDPESNYSASAGPLLEGIFQGSSTLRHHFSPVSGSLEEELNDGSESPILVADVKLIIAFDDRAPARRAAYLCRFWFNRTSSKWQPIVMIGIPSQPRAVTLPALMF